MLLLLLVLSAAVATAALEPPPVHAALLPAYMDEHAPTLLTEYARAKLATLHGVGNGEPSELVVREMTSRMLLHLERQDEETQLRFLKQAHARLGV
jgi:hypothetical protein